MKKKTIKKETDEILHILKNQEPYIIKNFGDLGIFNRVKTPMKFYDEPDIDSAFRIIELVFFGPNTKFNIQTEVELIGKGDNATAVVIDGEFYMDYSQKVFDAIEKIVSDKVDLICEIIAIITIGMGYNKHFIRRDEAIQDYFKDHLN